MVLGEGSLWVKRANCGCHRLEDSGHPYASQEATDFLVLLDGATVDWVLMREEGYSAELWKDRPEGCDLSRQAWGTVLSISNEGTQPARIEIKVRRKPADHSLDWCYTQNLKLL